MKLSRVGAAALLVIGAFAAALVFPAISISRESSRRMQCTSNVKELLLGLQNYHDTFLYLPFGARNRWDVKMPEVENATWGPSWLPVTKQLSNYQIHTSLYDRMVAADHRSTENDFISAAVREPAHHDTTWQADTVSSSYDTVPAC